VVAHWVAARILGRKRCSIFRAGRTGAHAACTWRAGMPELATEPQGGLLRDEQAIMQHAVNLIDKYEHPHTGTVH